MIAWPARIAETICAFTPHTRPACRWEDRASSRDASYCFCLCLQGGHKSWHELVDPKHFLAALDHHDIPAPQQAGNFLRFKGCRIFMPSETFANRQQVVQMAHQWTYTIDAINSRQMFGQCLVIGWRLNAKLQHIAQNRDAPAFAKGPRVQALQRRYH